MTDCKSLHDAIHKEGAARSSTDIRATEGEADSMWVDARDHIGDSLTKHASRTSEEGLQQVINQAQWRITAVEAMLETRRGEREREREIMFRQEVSEGGIR